MSKPYTKTVERKVGTCPVCHGPLRATVAVTVSNSEPTWPDAAEKVLLSTSLRLVAMALEHHCDKRTEGEEARPAAPEGDDGPCQTCGQMYPAWRAADAFWNTVVGGPGATDDPGGLLCPLCFLRLADERAPIQGVWMIGSPPLPSEVEAELRRAQFHERENYARWKDAEAGAEALRARVGALASEWGRSDNYDVVLGGQQFAVQSLRAALDADHEEQR